MDLLREVTDVIEKNLFPLTKSQEEEIAYALLGVLVEIRKTLD